MSTPELEQAIASARWRGAEASAAEAIGKMLDVDPAIVERVIFAWSEMKSQAPVALTWLSDERRDLAEGAGLPPDVADAIERAAAYAVRRVSIRRRMERGEPIHVPFNKLVPASDPGRICYGCTRQFECVRDLLSTPASCLAGTRVVTRDLSADARARQFQYVNAVVKPTRLMATTVTVVADHPSGTYEVGLLDVVI